MRLANRIADVLFFCTHDRYGWPRGSGIHCTVSCLDCGKTLPYSWSEMRVITTPRKPDLEMQENEILVGGRIQ